MPDTVEVNQKAAIGAQNTQIAYQENNQTIQVGMSAEQASKIAIDLFMDNFPRLQQIAEKTALQRVNQFCESTIQQLIKDGISDFCSFSDPDVQYVLLNAQKDYARFGTEEMLETLGHLISKRIKYDSDFYLKIIIDKALSIVNMLTPQQIDLLSLLFICKHVKFGDITDIGSLQKHFDYVSNVFIPSDIFAFQFLNDMGCLSLRLMDISENYATIYQLKKVDVERILPEKIRKLSGDYGLSYVGIILAIINAEKKTSYRFDPHIWIKG